MKRPQLVELVNEWRGDGTQELMVAALWADGWVKSDLEDPLDIDSGTACIYKIVDKPKPVDIEDGTTVRSKSLLVEAITTFRQDFMDSIYYEIAYDQPQQPEWIPWKGGECPDDAKDRPVVVITRKGTFYDSERGVGLNWSHLDHAGDILWYCVPFKFMFPEKL